MGLPVTTRVVALLRRPDAAGPTPADFAVEERPLPPLAGGQLLVANIAMSVDPSMRGRLEPTEKHYTTNFEVGEPLDGSAVGVVLAGEGEGIVPGSVVRHRLGWREHAVVDANAATAVDVGAAPVGAWLGILGQTGLTAYVGLVRTAELRAGDTVFVSAAAGAVGSAAGQFAHLLGAKRVLGSAGGADKVNLLVDELGYDAAFDYRAESARDALEQAESDVASARRESAPRLAGQIESTLRSLAMPSARFSIAVEGSGPADQVSFLLGANPGEALQPLAKAASGGELARTMLAVRLAITDSPGVMVFDEVDAGVGGAAATSVGRALAGLGHHAQVLVVTHLAQVAALADHQIEVRKSESAGRTRSEVVALDAEGRVIEISRMLSGRPDSSSARRHARELLEGATARTAR